MFALRWRELRSPSWVLDADTHVFTIDVQRGRHGDFVGRIKTHGSRLWVAAALNGDAGSFTYYYCSSFLHSTALDLRERRFSSSLPCRKRVFSTEVDSRLFHRS